MRNRRDERGLLCTAFAQTVKIRPVQYRERSDRMSQSRTILRSAAQKLSVASGRFARGTEPVCLLNGVDLETIKYQFKIER